MIKRFFSKKYKEMEKYLNKKIIKRNIEEENNKYDHLVDFEIKKNLKLLNKERFYFRKIDQTKFITDDINPDYKSLYPITNPDDIADCTYLNTINDATNIPSEIKFIQKFSNISLIGPSNSGKSYLLNKLLNKRVSSVSDKKYTTFETIKGYYFNKEKEVLLNFFDFPSFDDSNLECLSKLEESDMVLFVVDIKKSLEDKIFKFLNILNKELQELDGNKPEFILVLNKADTIKNKNKINDIIKSLESFISFKKYFITSCETNFMIDDLKNYLIDNSVLYEEHKEYNEINLINNLNKTKKEENIVYNKEEIIEVEEEPRNYKEKSYSYNIEFDINNMIKSLIYNSFNKELPYIIEFEIVKLSFFSQKTLKLTFKLKVPTKNHTGIILGKKANFLHKIKKELQVLIFQNLGFKADIDIFLVVSPSKKFSTYDHEKLIMGDDVNSVLNSKEIQYRLKKDEKSRVDKIINLIE